MKLPLLPIAFVGLAFGLTYCSPPAEKETIAVEEVTETPSYSIVEQHELVWKQAITQLLEMADAMPEDRYDYKPHDSLKTFAGQLAHIAGSSKVIANMFLKDIKPAGPPPDMDLSGISREDLKNMVSTSLNEAWDIIKTMSNDQLLNETTTSFSGNTMSRLEGMMFAHDHLTNHKGKANMYIRMSGISPPKYRYY
ncbi:DinB family protein [Reichenbachiella sp. MALMAid0571]|uniref:DinB family protein n=1 Tax=Reichenbachiella sp. MALMAid0571 TaxID=3143939 RepID=UPI0032DE89F5